MDAIQLIPVIDIKDGIVVHAKCGQRDKYRAIESVLSTQSDMDSIMNGFLSLYAFDTFYIADLNAITQQGDNQALIYRVIQDFPSITFWVDAGRVAPVHFPVNYLPVLGSEYLTDNDVQYLTQFHHRFILSLDYGANGEKLGAKTLWQTTTLWPDKVIIMTLATVGAAQGVALNILDTFRKHYPHKQFIAAGGVRNREDMLLLKRHNIPAVLLASALHSGAIGQHDIKTR